MQAFLALKFSLASAAPQLKSASMAEQVVVVAERAWLRDLPDDRTPTHNWAARGALLNVVRRSDDGAWLRIAVRGGAGHIAMSWIRLSDCQSTRPANSP